MTSPSQNALLCTNTTELGKNFYFLGWQKQSKLFLHKAENIKIHLAIIKLLLNYSKMRSIFFPNGNFGPCYLLHWWKRPQSRHKHFFIRNVSLRQDRDLTAINMEGNNWASFFGKFWIRFWAVCCNIFQQWKKIAKEEKRTSTALDLIPEAF